MAEPTMEELQELLKRRRTGDLWSAGPKPLTPEEIETIKQTFKTNPIPAQTVPQSLTLPQQPPFSLQDVAELKNTFKERPIEQPEERKQFPGKPFVPQDESGIGGTSAQGAIEASRTGMLRTAGDWASRILGGISKADYRPAAQMALRSGAHIAAGEPLYQFDREERNGYLSPYQQAYLETQKKYSSLAERREDRLEKVSGRIPSVDARKLSMHLDALSKIETIKQEVDEGELGPIWGRIRRGMMRFGIGDPNLAKTNANLISMFASYVKGISGVAVSEKEFMRLYPSIPNIAQEPQMFKALLENFEQQIRNEHQNLLSVLRANKFDVEPFEIKEDGLQPAVGSGMAGQKKIRGPDGEVYFASPEQIKAMQDAGEDIEVLE